MIELQVGVPINPFSLAWGGEFRPFSKYFQSKGIVHRFICPHTHHQNGTIERKHCHITEIAFTLLAQAATPLSYRDEVVATATHIINRIPPSSLHSPSSFEVLFHHPPLYSSFRATLSLGLTINTNLHIIPLSVYFWDIAHIIKVIDA